MRTIKSETVNLIVRQIAVLGLVGNDTTRLAKRFVEGKHPCTIEEFANVLHNSCRDTINDDQDYLLRTAGEDLVIYGPRGFAVYNHVEGVLEVARTYRSGESFASMTGIYQQAEELDLQEDELPTQYALH